MRPELLTPRPFELPDLIASAPHDYCLLRRMIADESAQKQEMPRHNLEDKRTSAIHPI